ncbi:OmpA family protein, partial [Flavobacterium sp.]|uniref:OmpA family protein n=1 Tax=Flavobacterium sp. TaxID=239 RepID=UPI002FDD8645
MLRKISILFILICGVELSAQEQISFYFDSNKFELNKKETNKLNQWILTNNNNKIVAIHGFTDEDGTTGFNDTLARKRVDFVYGIVKDQIKIRDDFKTLSFGEKFQQSANKAENRKVTVYY